MLGVLLSTPAVAQTLDQAEIDEYQEIRMMCRQGEDQNGPISRAASASACEELDTLGADFKERGYCWDSREQDWYFCSLMN